MNCPHGRAWTEPCHERACVQQVFEPLRPGPVVWVVKLQCDLCGRGVGKRLRADRARTGLSARTIREFQHEHAGHTLYWKMIEVDTGREVLGAGQVPVRVDSDEKNVSLTNPRS